MKQLFTLIRMVQLSLLTEERVMMRRNEEKHENENKVPFLDFNAFLIPFWHVRVIMN